MRNPTKSSSKHLAAAIIFAVAGGVVLATAAVFALGYIQASFLRPAARVVPAPPTEKLQPGDRIVGIDGPLPESEPPLRLLASGGAELPIVPQRTGPVDPSNAPITQQPKVRAVQDAPRPAISFKGHPGLVHGAAFNPDGKKIVSGGDDTSLKIWDADSGRERLTLTGHEASIAEVVFDPHGKRVASCSLDHTARVWNVENGQQVAAFTGHPDRIYCLDFSPDGRRIVSGGEGDHRLRVWSAATGQEELILNGHENWVVHVRFSPDGRRIVSGSYDKTIRIWDASNGNELLSIAALYGGLDYSPDGKWIAAGVGNAVKIWDANTGRELKVLTPNDDYARDVAFSPDGKRIVVGTGDELRLWDVEKSEVLLTLPCRPGPINVVQFSPDGKRVLGINYNATEVASSVDVWTVSP